MLIKITCNVYYINFLKFTRQWKDSSLQFEKYDCFVDDPYETDTKF